MDHTPAAVAYQLADQVRVLNTLTEKPDAFSARLSSYWDSMELARMTTLASIPA